MRQYDKGTLAGKPFVVDGSEGVGIFGGLAVGDSGMGVLGCGARWARVLPQPTSLGHGVGAGFVGWISLRIHQSCGGNFGT
jgi:hypothetical protein